MEADMLGATLNMLGATLLDPGPPADTESQSDASTAAAPMDIPPSSGTVASDPTGPIGTTAAAPDAVTLVTTATAARPMLALVDTAPPPLGLLAAGPAAVTLVDPAPLPAALAVAVAAVDPMLLRVVELTNAERAAVGVASLAGNLQLTLAAQRYAEVMADTACFGHACGPLPQLGDRAWAAGDARWGFLGENVAAGQPTPERVVAGWMASSTHRAVLLNPEFTLLGVGRALGGPYGTYWTQEFGTPSTGAPAAAPAPPAEDVARAVALLNIERAGAGLRPLLLDVHLVYAVEEGGAAQPVAGGALLATPTGDTGRTILAEPSLAGPAPGIPGGAVAQWRITAHDMLLDPQYTDAGVGVVAGPPGQGQDRVYWTDTSGIIVM